MIKTCGGSDGLEVETAKVEKRSVVESVSANGKIQPEVEVKISSDVPGEITELNVKEGDMVKKGDLLLKIKPDIFQSNLDRMIAAVNTSKANLANSLARYEQMKVKFKNDSISYSRSAKLYNSGTISQSEFETAKTLYETSKGEVVAAWQSVKASEFTVMSSEASLKEANENLTKTTIVAPVDGRIIRLNVEKGEKIVGTSQMAGTELMVLASSNEMEVSVEVNESDIVKVHLKDTALVEVDAYLNRKFKGIVTEIAHSANTIGISADQVTNFVVKIRILQDSYKDLDNPFRRGMSATVDILTKYANNVISVPIQSVTVRSDSAFMDKKDGEGEQSMEEVGDLEVTHNDTKQDKKEIKSKGEECVFLLVDGKAKLVKVKTGIQDEDFMEILEGLKEGDVVIAGPYTVVARHLKDGDEVTVKEKEEEKGGVSISFGTKE
ncbi:MAG: efflux RND transporter periplasmic adaptor subunit [Bacteroidia bacterium]|nr:efflux RND transporter periplasmic adaptor subunit [Bacteroidia bacterium]